MPRARVSLLSSFLVLGILLPAAVASAQDAITVDTVTASGSTVDVPVYIRDLSGTPLGVDQPAGSRIESYSITVTYAPASAVQSVTFSRAGITAGLTPTFESTPSSAGSITLLDAFSESTTPIPFRSNAPAPGDQVAHLVFTLSPSATAGTTITLTLDPSQAKTQLSNEGGTIKEMQGSGLTLVNGAIQVPQASIAFSPTALDVAVGTTTNITLQASGAVASNTTVTLTSSAPSVATVPPSVVIPAGAASVTVPITASAIGTTTLTATLPQSAGGGTATAAIRVVAAPAECTTPAAPQVTAPAAAEVGKPYAVTWSASNGATDYVIDESTDVNFGTATGSQTVTGTSASFTRSAAGRYYYRVRARNNSAGCATTSPFSSVVSVLVSPALTAQTRVLAVVGSTAGSFGSFFKTSVQMYNPGTSPISGKIVYHPQGVSGSASEPSLAFTLAAKKTLSYADLLPAIGAGSGLGSADLIADAGSSFPIVLARVFNDGGASGTTGLSFEPMNLADALQSGDSGTLIAPIDAQKLRLNIGIRTLADGASLTFTVRDKDGGVVKTSSRDYGPTFFTQPSASTVLDGYVLAGGETITVTVTRGSAFVYGSTTDNTTNDPSLQFARRAD